MAHIYHQTCYRPPCVWQHCSNGQLPSYTVLGGSEANGEPLYVGRAIQSGDTIPGKVNLSHRGCYVALHGREYHHPVYQMLTNPSGSDLVWLPAIKGELPSGAIQGGQESATERNGEKLYIGRAYHNGSLVIGKVYPGYKCLYIPYDGKEIMINDFEVLVCKDICH